ncbi:hypothetical protein K438DRAFT_1934827, partial [Mycena galopus ATCC 62051]
MDNARHVDDEYAARSTMYCPEIGHGNGMFSSSHHFTVTAQSLTNITKNYTTTPNVPSDVRTFPLGDIDLQHEIQVDGDTGVVDWQGPRPRVRRIYSARIESRKSSTMVAIYQGDGAEEEWRQDVAKYMAVRHPWNLRHHNPNHGVPYTVNTHSVVSVTITFIRGLLLSIFVSTQVYDTSITSLVGFLTIPHRPTPTRMRRP